MTALTASLFAVAKPKTQTDTFAVLAFALRRLTAQGMPAHVAFDAVLGEGQWDMMVDDLYVFLGGEAHAPRVPHTRPADLELMLRAATTADARALYASVSERDKAELALHVAKQTDGSFEDAVTWLLEAYG